MVMAFGPTKCGKTTALNCAASITGSKIWGTGTGFSLAAAYQQAHGSTMGYCLDDVKDDKMLEDIVVGTYNQGGQVNMAVGRKTPKCTPVLTSNFVPSDPRVLSRLAIIPFFIPSNPLREPERMNKEMEVMDAMELAGRNIGIVIKVGSIYQQEQERDHIYGNLTEFTMNAIGEEFIREAVNYAEVIGFTDMFCCQIEGPTLDELKVYFTDVVAPFFIKDIAKKGDQSSGSNVISGGLQYTAKDIQDEIAAMCTKDPQKAIHFIYPSTLCNDTKERCVGISVTEFVDAAQKRFPLSSVRDLLKPLICQCKTRHQAPFLNEKATIPPCGPIILRKKGEDKNASLRMALFVKRKSFGEDHLMAIDKTFNTSNWPHSDEGDDHQGEEKRQNEESHEEEPPKKTATCTVDSD